ncbi:hypothetical protein Bbelb_166070 [Branchiostoma belcheri]|nr:hypothetical protein Bbelb_166070 [Branchiostoma belcheri]
MNTAEGEWLGLLCEFPAAEEVPTWTGDGIHSGGGMINTPGGVLLTACRWEGRPFWVAKATAMGETHIRSAPSSLVEASNLLGYTCTHIAMRHAPSDLASTRLREVRTPPYHGSTQQTRRTGDHTGNRWALRPVRSLPPSIVLTYCGREDGREMGLLAPLNEPEDRCTALRDDFYHLFSLQKSLLVETRNSHSQAGNATPRPSLPDMQYFNYILAGCRGCLAGRMSRCGERIVHGFV